MPCSDAVHRRVAIVFNPAAGRSRRSRLTTVADKVKSLGCHVTVLETNAPGHAEAIVRALNDADFDIIAAAGGDGTVNEVVNGLQGKSMALAVIPLGTANVLADEVGLGRKADRIAEAIAHGAVRPIRVGTANGRRFVMMAGAGFDAEVVDGVRLDLKKIIGPLAYVWEMIRQAFLYRFVGCDVQIDGQMYWAVSAIVCNGRSYGGPFTAAPDADLEADDFQVVLFERSGWFNVLRYGLALVFGRLPYLSDIRIVPGRHIVIRGGDGAPVQADGDILARLPVAIQVDAEPVRFIFPA
jgi:YegS/Rv2252/BmrU family lipid kinase